MKKLKLSIIFLFVLHGLCSAQAFEADTKWYYCQGGFVNMDERCIVVELSFKFSTNDTIIGTYAFFNDKQEVKQLGNSTWVNGIKYYDFDLKVGDTITLYNYTNEIYRKDRIDSIATLFIKGKMRKVQFTTDFTHTEGLGMANKLEKDDYFFLPHLIFFIIDPGFELTHIKHGSTIISIDPNYLCRTCDNVVSNKEIIQNSINAYPNPVSDYITISGLSGETSHVSIIDIYGRRIVDLVTNKEVLELDVSHHLQGSYIAQITNQISGSSRVLRFSKL